jgi:hypothetical protein
MLLSNPSTAFFENFISTIKKGISSGKLSIAIKLKLDDAFEAIAETIVNIEEKPKLPRSKARKKNELSCTRFLIKTEYKI